MSDLRQLKVTFDSFDALVEGIGPGLSRTHLFAPTDQAIVAGTRVRLEIGTLRKGAAIRGVAKIAEAGEENSEPGLHLHLIHLDPSSTRLVDAIVRGEIAAASGAREASGPSPFDIAAAPKAPPRAAEVKSDAGEPPAAAVAGRLRRFAWPLASTALAVTLLWVFELVPRSGQDTTLLTGRDRQTETAIQPAAIQQAAAQPAATTLEAAEGAPGVERALRSWAAAWSRQDPEAYLELYAPDYSPPGEGRGDWERRRRQRIKAPQRLEIDISDLTVEIVDAGRARASFNQLYVTEDKSLATRKVLELEHFAAGWKIIAERVEPSP